MKDKQQRVAQIVHALRVAVRLAPQPRQVTAQPVVHGLDSVRARLALEMLGFVKDGSVTSVLVGGLSDCSATRNPRIQRPGRWGIAIAQRPAPSQELFG